MHWGVRSMITTNTSLSFSTKGQSVWAPGSAINLYIDTGDFLIFDSGEQVKEFGIDLWVIEASFEVYLDVRFGLLGWANLGSTGSWDASYEMDLFVEHTNAVLGGGNMIFDFSDYDIVSANISSQGFGPGEKGISAGLKMIVEISAGVRDIYVDWPWPFGSDNFGGFSLINIKESIDLIKVTAKLPSFKLELFDGIDLKAQLPQGADTKGDSTDSGVVSGKGTSKTNFIELSADLDKLLLKLLGTIPEPATQGVVKFLGETVFAEHTYDLGDYVGFIPDGKIQFKFTAVDITAKAGLALTEKVNLDITEKGASKVPDIGIMLTSDNGTPDDASDDKVAVGKLGDTLQLVAPRTTSMAPGEPPSVGKAIINAEYFINRALFTHDIGLAVTFGITIDILKGALKGSWVPSFLEVEFGPLKQINFPAEGDDGWEIDLGTLFSHDYEVNGSVFNKEFDAYEVFYVQPEIAPTGWNPDLPGAEGAVYDYFEASHKQLEALFDKFEDRYPATEYLHRPLFVNGVPPIGTLDYTSFISKVFFGWTAATDNKVLVSPTNGSIIMAAPAPRLTTNGPVIQDNLIVKYFYNDPFAGSLKKDLVYNLDWQTLFGSLFIDHDPTFTYKKVSYEYNGKILEAFGPTSAAGQSLGDVLYYNGGDFYDGGGNTGGQHDVFMANFAQIDFESPVNWNLAQAIEDENDGLASTMGGVTLQSGVTIKNVEAIIIKTGAGDDYIVSGTYSDAISTGGGDDVVKLTYAIKVGTGFTVDSSDDYVSLGSGDDIATVELGNVPVPLSFEYTDYILGGTGVDHVFVRAGVQGLRYNIKLFFPGGGVYSYVAGESGFGAESTHSQLDAMLDYFSRDIQTEFDTGAETALLPQAHYLLMNGSRKQGAIEISTDVESVSVVIDQNTSDQGVGDDLVVFMGGTYYDGGVSGNDTFAADFSAWEWRMGTRGGLFLDISQDVSYFGETTIKGMDRLHVIGTTEADIITGGLLDDYIEAGEGDDTLSGGLDTAADTLLGGDGDDRFFWVDAGSDTIDGGRGFDTLNISADQVPDTGTGSTSPDYKHGGNHTYTFFDSTGTSLSHLTTSSSLESIAEVLDLLAGFTVQSQTHSFGEYSMTHKGIEAINITASFDGNDIVIFQGGNYYDLGEASLGNDRDTFAADFRGQEPGIDFSIGGRYDTQTGKVLANGVYLSGMDRAVILAGDGNDILAGGWLSDLFDGGGGDDTLIGFEGNDILRGGEGSDTFFYDSQGYDEIEGGTNADGSPELDHLIIGGATWDTRVALRDKDGNDLLSASRGIVRSSSSREDIQDLAEKSLAAFEWQFYTRTPGNPTAWYGRSLTHVTYSEMEAVDIAGSDEGDDLIVYQGGVGYVGGERLGDADLFVADLRAFDDDLTLDVTHESGVGYDIGQGTNIADFERLHVLLGGGNDIVKGGDLDDTADGGAGDDEMSGGLGNDRLIGGAGDDLFEHIGGNDEIFGGKGNDALSISERDTALTLKLFDATDTKIGTTYSMTGTALSLADFVALFAITNAAYRVIDHGTSSVKFEGIEEIVMSGGDQNDVLIGGSLQGILFGGDGNDALIGQGGNDFMSGGKGSDIYVFGKSFGNDLIFGETAESSKVIFTDFTKADLTFAVDSVDLVINAGANSVRVLGYFAANTSVGLNFVFEATDGTFTKSFPAAKVGAGARAAVPSFTGDGVTFEGTNDDDEVLIGTDKSDLLRGFGGDDFFDSSKGADLIDGGAGRDAVSYLKSDGAVKIDLINFKGRGGHANGDLLVSIEHVNGSLFDDVITGNRFKNNLFGADGDDKIFGLEGDDFLTGDEGADIVKGGDGNDRVYGNDGRDKLFGGAGTDYVDGGDGKDVLKGDAGADILDDGLGADKSYGGSGDDFFIYAGGLDKWFGGSGRDTANFSRFGAAVSVDLLAGPNVTTRDGADMEASTGALRTLLKMKTIENIQGTNFDDILVGDSAINQIEGGLGNDIITGNAGDDVLIGGAGIDTLDYSKEIGGTRGVEVVMNKLGAEYATDTFGNRDVLSGFEVVIGTDLTDNIIGNALNNALHGGKGNDKLDGREGDDRLFGGDGDDNLFGQSGDDVFIGGKGADNARAGDGDDLFIEELGSGLDTYDGDADFDTVSYAALTTGITVNMDSSGDYHAFVSATDKDKLYDIENVIGSLGDDVMNGSIKDNWFSYVGGLDTYDGKSGSDTAVYKYFTSAVHVDLLATDTARTRNGTDLKSGTWETITRMKNMENIVGSDFDDTLIADPGVRIGDAVFNMLYGGKGNDTLDGGAGNDFVFGEEGNDFLINTPTSGKDFLDGGEGFDTLDYSAMTTYVSASLVDGDGDDVITSIERLLGTDFDDSLRGNAGANVLQGGKGDDLLQAGEGDDILVYTDDYDYFYGEGGNDTADYSLFGSAIDLDFRLRDAVSTRDTKDWDVGTDREITLIYSFDVENAIGTDFNDRLIGNAGANMFNGGLGNDLLLGNGGGDMFNYAGGLDDWNGGAGLDTANFSTYRFAVAVDLTSGGAKTKEAANLDTGTLKTLVKLTNIENIIGSGFDDELRGDVANNAISGFVGNDKLFGGAGDDTLTGDDGDDVLTGGLGGDTLNGGKGIDTASYASAIAGVTLDLLVGKGTVGEATGDTFEGIENVTGSAFDDDIIGDKADNVLNGGNGNDTMAGLAGADKISGGGGNDILSGGDGEDSLFGEIGNDKMSGNDGDDKLVGANGKDTLRGGAQNDLLIGGAGNDKLFGDTGNDKLLGGSGKDVLNGSDGFDFLKGDGGDDILNGGIGGDKMIGGTGNDVLKGEGGDDQLQGGKGNDILDGGLGSDLFIFGKGDGKDIIRNFDAVYDTIKVGKGAASFSDLTIVKAGKAVEISFADVTIKLSGTDIADVTTDIFTF